MAKQRTETGSPSDSGRRPPLLQKLLGLLLLSVFMFTVGVFVGRGTAPVKFDIPGIQERLKSLRAEAFREDAQRYRIESETPGDRRPMKFREVLRNPADPPAAPPAGAAAGATPPAVNRPKPAASPATAPADRPAPAATAPAETSERPYILQVASMKEGEAAAAMVEKLKKQGYPAYRESIEIPDKGVWYRVRVGAYPDREAAEAAQLKMGAVAKGAMVIRK
ncbi:MAG: SPOR domain-containing protein [Pseudomonadota bacterium]